MPLTLDTPRYEFTLDVVADAVHQNAIAHGFHDDPVSRVQFVKDSLLLNISENIEIFEAIRSDALDEPCNKAAEMNALGLKTLTSLEEELADVVIRALAQARHLNIDLVEAIRHKHLFNVARPFKHNRVL